MATPPTDSILAADIGNVTTRAALFDIVSGEFRFVAVGEARSTVEPPYNHIGEAVRHALRQLEAVTGRSYLDENEWLIVPGRADGAGVDAFVATASAGEPLRVALVGLMPNVSLVSAQRIAASSYVRVMEVIGLGDRRREEQQIDALIAAKPEIVIIAGGTEHGSQSVVYSLAATVAMAVKQMPYARPEILFAGNSALRDRVAELFAGMAEVVVADNVRPVLDDENLAPARRQLSRLYEHIRLSSTGGYAEMAQWGNGTVVPTATAFGSVIRFLDMASSADRGVLGVDVGSLATTVAASFGGELSLAVRPDIGVGHSAAHILRHVSVDRLARWLPAEPSDGELRDYIYNKSLAPATVPYELEELYLEHALARECLQVALAWAQPHWPARAKASRSGLLPWFEQIVGSGAVLARAPRPGQAALLLLDGLQPTGLTRLLLDWRVLAPTLGAAATVNPVAAVQAIQSGTFLDLGLAIGLVGEARPGQSVVRVRVSPSGGGAATDRTVPFGSVEVVPIPPGQEARVAIRPLRGFDAGFGPGVSKTVTVAGSAVGLIVDARGRPIAFPGSPSKRSEAVSRWCMAVGEYGA